MNDFEAWEKIISEWKQVNRMKRLNQELYDLLYGEIIYLNDYAKANNLEFPQKEAIERTISRIHNIMDSIDSICLSTDNQHGQDEPNNHQNH